ncbi:hypothetical protein [Streptomyces sp. NPDC006610]|uniref:hypothetical protein n=1 Tax=Streptomyces sp. NPDC006610 TaxID=3154584 RepID=UPI0033AB97CA
MTIVIDAKNETKRSIDGLGTRVNDLERDLRAALTTEIAGLRDTALADVKSSQHETRTSAYNAGKRASEAVAAVADLRRDVDRLHDGLEGLRQDVGKILEALQAAAPTRVPTTAGLADDPFLDQVGTEAGPDSVILPAQRQAPDQESTAHVEPADPNLCADGSPGGEEPGASTAVEAPVTAADGEEANQTSPDAEQSPPGTGDLEDGDHDVVRAAREAGEQDANDSLTEPSPLTWKGRIWAIMRAGRVASATLVCHRDTWEFVAAQVGSHPHFRTPALEERENGSVAAVLSGRSLVAMLLALYHTANTSLRKPGGEDDLIAYADWAMASEVYSATARVLSTAHYEEGDPVVVTIDRRVRARA